MADAAEAGLRGNAAYWRFWWASSVSEFGTYITALAIQVLVVVDLHGKAAEVGLITGARWLPYMLFGVVAGVFVDRVRRRSVCIAADFARGALLLLVPLLALSGRLSIWGLAAFMAAFGLFSLAGDAAAQSLVPRLVPTPLLTRAHARLDQSSAVAQTSGPALAGVLVSLVGAPWAVVADAVSYLFSGLMLLSVRIDEPVAQARPAERAFGREVAEGLRWVYRHPTLAPLALSTHAWFIVNGVAGAVQAPFMLQTLRLSPALFGVALSAVGVGGLAGSLMATRLGARFGAGRVVIGCRVLTPLAYVLLALAAPGWAGVALVAASRLVFGLSIGAENANEMAYRQAVTPDRLQGRTNATMRSINRAMLVFAAPLGGLAADAIGYRPMLWLVALGFGLVPLALALTPFRSARVDRPPPVIA
ncbi:MAG TPA: MFS transporter [Caulobacteraceae bacterium]|nr:MFS transporter [Caulobacteraceae bacterium]